MGQDGAEPLLHGKLGAIVAQFALVTLAGSALVYALVSTDFSIKYVAMNTTRATPIDYRVTGVWGALEGSLLLWEWILVIFAALVRLVVSDSRAAPPAVGSLRLLGRLRLLPRGDDVRVEDGNMLTHPPLLYTGFVGLTMPYAFAITALVTGKLDDGWLIATRKWTLSAWFFLSMGNLVGAWWSYHMLGWGGYWAWGPVENAAFMPWPPATAFLHSIQIQERRGMLKT